MHEIIIGRDRAAVGRLIGKGGEGEVFEVSGRPQLAVKIYNTQVRGRREDKVRAMVNAGLAVKTDLVAYPGDVATDPHGQFVGFVMRLVSGYRPLHELYSPKSRQRHFPTADYRFVIRTALNVARAVGKVHQTGCVIGDLNHSGVLIGSDATVALIDADSFQFRLNGKSYPCVVGVPDFTPPELHGKNLGTVERTVEHDNFGLAVAIFHLLFMGRHPYAGRHNGPDISLGDAIAQNRFAYSLARQSATATTPPPGALTLDLFPGVVGSAFEAAFGLHPAARPSPSDWVLALTMLEGSLSRCSKIKSHFYPSNAKRCVWCELAVRTGFDMFLDLSVAAPGITTDPAGTEALIREILAFRFPTAAELLPQPPAVAADGSSALRDASREQRTRAILGVFIILGALAGFVVLVPFWFLWIGLGVLGGSFIARREVGTGPFQSALLKANERVQRELDSFVRRSGLIESLKVRSDLDGAIAAYKAHDESRVRELAKHKAGREARQRAAFLDQFSIRSANISGIGPAKKAALISFGIETAADVDYSAVIQVSGFGDVMTGKLIEWRRKHEARFRYDPQPNAQDIADETALRNKFAAERAKQEATIRTGAAALRNARARIDALQVMARNDQSLRGALEERELAKRDLELLGVSVPSAVYNLPVPPAPLVTPISSAPTQFPATPLPHAPSPWPPSTRGTVPTCPHCGSSMRRRSGRRGPFWGCSRYPRCRGTRNI